MRIILDGSVSTVKRLRVALGTLVAIEATVDGKAPVGGPVVPSSTAHQQSPAAYAAAGGTVAARPPAHQRTPAADDVIAAEVAVARAFDAIEQVDRLMHPRAEGSDLARINCAPLHTTTQVHASVGQLLNLAKRINTLSEGVFDPCTPAQPGRLSDVEVSADETEVICHAPVALDFGGFAKGYAVDCAIEALMAGGCTAGLVNAGGDLRVFGQRGEPVFVRGPEGELTAIELVDAALAVSDATSGKGPVEHQGYYVRSATPATAANQRTGGSARPTTTADHHPSAATSATAVDQHAGARSKYDSATTYAAVIAPTAVIADALSKCVLLCPPPVSTRVLREFRATLARSDGRAG